MLAPLPSLPVAAPLQVLVVDDSTVVRRHLVDLLHGITGVRVVGEAGDTTAAVEAVATLAPDVVLLDIQMPGENGIVALQRIKARWPGTEVIMLTNHAHPLYRERCLRDGAHAFFDKSTEVQEVESTIRALSEGAA